MAIQYPLIEETKVTHIIPFENGRIAILSDLHLDSYVRAGQDFVAAHCLEAVLDSSLDALIIAGDLTNGPASRWVAGLNRLTPHIAPERIFVFPGNHDYYGGSLTDDPLLAENAQSIGAHFVQKEELRHGNTRFLCCTLWTDFDLLEDTATAMDVAGRVMNDYGQIWKDVAAVPLEPKDELGWRSHRRTIKPADTLAVHHDHHGWLMGRLSTPHPAGDAGRTVVVTHHGPHVSVAGSVDNLTPAFHSDLSDLIEAFEPDAWFFGHSHRRLRATVGQTDVRNVSVGYAREFHRSESEYLVDVCIWES